MEILLLDGQALTLTEIDAVALRGRPVGIAPAAFYGDRISNNPPAFWMPLSIEPLLRQANSILRQSSQSWLYAIGRLKPGTQVGPLQQKISANVRRWIATDDSYTREGVSARLPKVHVLLTPAGAGIQDLQRKEIFFRRGQFCCELLGRARRKRRFQI